VRLYVNGVYMGPLAPFLTEQLKYRYILSGDAQNGDYLQYVGVWGITHLDMTAILGGTS
jgi:hypothetical protein